MSKRTQNMLFMYLAIVLLYHNNSLQLSQVSFNAKNLLNEEIIRKIRDIQRVSKENVSSFSIVSSQPWIFGNVKL